MSINGVNINSQIQASYERLNSGKRINSAADDAAGMAIAGKMTSQINGFDQGTSNAEDMKNLAKTAEGGLASITDSLQRIRELSVQASNGILTDEDRGLMQKEVSQLLDQIKSSAEYTEFNSIKLLDGNFADMNTAENPTGNGMKISIENSSLESLGIDGYDLTGDFDISKIDNALEMVSDARSKIGSNINALDHTIDSNMNAYASLAESRSRIEDSDMAREIMNLKKNQTLQQYQIMASKNKMEQQQNRLTLLQ